MGVSLLAALDGDYQQRLLEVDQAVLVGVHRTLVKAKVCAKPVRGGPAAAIEGLKGLIAGLTTEQDARKIERTLATMQRVLSGRSDWTWFKEAKPTEVMIHWIITFMAVARLIQLDAMTKPSAVLTAVMNDLLKMLAVMQAVPESDEADCIHLRGFTKALVVCIVTSVQMRDKAQALSIFKALKLRAEDIFVTLPASLVGGKVKGATIEFCRTWISDAPFPDALQATHYLLEKCTASTSWHRLYNDVISERPILAALLVEDVDVICEDKIGDASYRRFALENLMTGLQVADSAEAPAVDRLICIALHDQDVFLRALAWKVLNTISGKIGRREHTRLLVLACDAFFVEESRSVAAAILKYIALAHHAHLNTTSSSNEDCVATRRVQDGLLCLMSQRAAQFPSSWIHDAMRILLQGDQKLSSELVMKSFSTGTKEGHKLLADVYRGYLMALGDVAARRELHGLARCVGIDTIPVFDSLIGSVCSGELTSDPKSKTDGQRSSRDSLKLPVGCYEEQNVSSRQDRCANILLESAISRASADSSPRLEALCRACSQMLEDVSVVLETDQEDSQSKLGALAALRGFRVAVELSSIARSAYVADVENALQSRLATLVSIPTLQREVVKLLYLLTSPQEKAYWCLALSQDDAFIGVTELASFITLVGTVASENAHYLAQQQLLRDPQEPIDGFDDGEEKQQEGEDYMEHFKDTIALKNRIKIVKEASISDGLLSAYLPLVERAMESNQAVRVKVAAIWTLGEFMKISSGVSEVYFGKLLNILSGEGSPAIIMACIDVWYTLQPSMKPSRMKEQGVEVMYRLIVGGEKSSPIVTHALKCLQLLVLHAQLRDDHLYLFSSFLLSPNRTIVQRFFRSYFLQHSPSRASSIIFEIYFALLGESRTKSTAKKVTACLMELVKDGMDSLTALESALADELESATRCIDALHLLGQFKCISASTVQKMIGSIDRLLSSSAGGAQNQQMLEQMLVKQLQRTKGKCDKTALKDAISKLRHQTVGEHAARERRVPLNVVSIGRLVHNLRG